LSNNLRFTLDILYKLGIFSTSSGDSLKVLSFEGFTDNPFLLNFTLD